MKAIFTLEAGLAWTGAQSDATSSLVANHELVFRVVSVPSSSAVKINPVYATASPGICLVTHWLVTHRVCSATTELHQQHGVYNYAAGGFYGELQYGLGEIAGNNSITGENSAGRTAAMFVGYKTGPFDVVLTHQNIHNNPYTTAAKMTLLGGNYISA